MDKKLKITNISVEPKRIYDTFRGAITISACLNDKPFDFVFRGSRYDDPMFAGIDCNEAKWGNYTWNGREHKTKISCGGTSTSYALHLYNIKSAPKENQKDFRFTGQEYSTRPLKEEFKKTLRHLWETNDVTNEFKNAILDN